MAWGRNRWNRETASRPFAAVSTSKPTVRRRERRRRRLSSWSSTTRSRQGGWAGASDRARACGLAGDCAEAEGDGEDAAVAFDAANGDVAFHHAGELAADG